ncbi:hypothetical protein CLF_104092, partial [Clonorchis sinensis]
EQKKNMQSEEAHRDRISRANKKLAVLIRGTEDIKARMTEEHRLQIALHEEKLAESNSEKENMKNSLKRKIKLLQTSLDKLAEENVSYKAALDIATTQVNEHKCPDVNHIVEENNHLKCQLEEIEQYSKSLEEKHEADKKELVSNHERLVKSLSDELNQSQNEVAKKEALIVLLREDLTLTNDKLKILVKKREETDEKNMQEFIKSVEFAANQRWQALLEAERRNHERILEDMKVTVERVQNTSNLEITNLKVLLNEATDIPTETMHTEPYFGLLLRRLKLSSDVPHFTLRASGDPDTMDSGVRIPRHGNSFNHVRRSTAIQPYRADLVGKLVETQWQIAVGGLTEETLGVAKWERWHPGRSSVGSMLQRVLSRIHSYVLTICMMNIGRRCYEILHPNGYQSRFPTLDEEKENGARLEEKYRKQLQETSNALLTLTEEKRVLEERTDSSKRRELQSEAREKMLQKERNDFKRKLHSAEEQLCTLKKELAEATLSVGAQKIQESETKIILLEEKLTKAAEDMRMNNLSHETLRRQLELRIHSLLSGAVSHWNERKTALQTLHNELRLLHQSLSNLRRNSCGRLHMAIGPASRLVVTELGDGLKRQLQEEMEKKLECMQNDVEEMAVSKRKELELELAQYKKTLETDAKMKDTKIAKLKEKVVKLQSQMRRKDAETHNVLEDLDCKVRKSLSVISETRSRAEEAERKLELSTKSLKDLQKQNKVLLERLKKSSQFTEIKAELDKKWASTVNRECARVRDEVTAKIRQQLQQLLFSQQKTQQEETKQVCPCMEGELNELKQQMSVASEVDAQKKRKDRQNVNSSDRLGQPGSIPALMLPSGGMATRHRKGVTAERFFFNFT